MSQLLDVKGLCKYQHPPEQRGGYRGCCPGNRRRQIARTRPGTRLSQATPLRTLSTRPRARQAVSQRNGDPSLPRAAVAQAGLVPAPRGRAESRRADRTGVRPERPTRTRVRGGRQPRQDKWVQGSRPLLLDPGPAPPPRGPLHRPGQASSQGAHASRRAPPSSHTLAWVPNWPTTLSPVPRQGFRPPQARIRSRPKGR